MSIEFAPEIIWSVVLLLLTILIVAGYFIRHNSPERAATRMAAFMGVPTVAGYYHVINERFLCVKHGSQQPASAVEPQDQVTLNDLAYMGAQGDGGAGHYEIRCNTCHKLLAQADVPAQEYEHYGVL